MADNLTTNILASLGQQSTTTPPPPAIPGMAEEPERTISPENITKLVGSATTAIPDVIEPVARGSRRPLTPEQQIIARQLAARQLASYAQAIPRSALQVATAEGLAGVQPETSTRMGLAPGTIAHYANQAISTALDAGTSALSAVGATLSRPQQAIFHAARAYGQGADWERAAAAGLRSQKFWFDNPDHVSFDKVLETYGVPDGDIHDLIGIGPVTSRQVIGFVGDMLLDPVNFVTIGGAKAAQYLSKAGRYLNPAGMRALTEMSETGLLASPLFKQWLEKAGRPDLAGKLETLAPTVKKMLDSPELVGQIKKAYPDIVPTLGEIHKTMLESYANNTFRVPHPADPRRFLDLTEITSTIKEDMADKLSDLIIANKPLMKQITEKGGLKFAGVTIIPGSAGRVTKDSIRKALSYSAAKVEDLGAAVEKLGGESMLMRSIGESIQALPAAAEGLGDTVGKSLSTVYGLPRDFADFLQSRFYSRFKNVEHHYRKRIDNIFRGTTYAQRVAITKALDSGKVDTFLASIPAGPARSQMSKVMDQIKDMTDELFAEQAARGLIAQEDYNPNYIYHLYKNPRRTRMTLVAEGRLPSAGSLDPATYQRAFPTLAEAELHGLKPEYDAGRLLAARALNGWRSIIAHDFYTGSLEKYGVLPKFTEGKLIASLAEGEAGPQVIKPLWRQILEDGLRLDDPSDALSLGQRLAIEGKPDLRVFEVLPDEVKRHFFNERFYIAARRGGEREVENVRKRYASFKEWWPKGETGNPAFDAMQLPRLDKFDGSWKTLAIPGVGQALFPERIADKIVELQKTGVFTRETGSVIRNVIGWYDKLLLNPFRKWNTLIWPSFHIRNWYTNVFQSGMDINLAVINPLLHDYAIDMLKGRNLGRAFSTKTGEKVNLGQLVSEFQRYGGFNTLYKRAMISTSGAAQALADEVMWDLSAKAGMKGSILVKPWFYPRAMRTFGTLIENEARLLHFLTLRRDGLQPAAAMSRVHKFLFDYDNITAFDREGMRRLIPFWVWIKKNTALQAEMLARKPYYYHNIDKIFQKLQTETDHPERSALEKSLLPQYLHAEYGIPLGQGIAPQTKKYLLGLDLPQSDLLNLKDRTVQETVDRWLSATGPASEIGQALLAWAGYDNELAKGIDTGSPSYPVLKYLVDRRDEPVIGRLTSFLDIRWHLDKYGRPVIYANPAKMKSLAVVAIMNRPLRELSRFVDHNSGDSWTSALARYFTGVRFTEVNPNELMRIKQFAALDKATRYAETATGQLKTSLIEQGLLAPEADIFNPSYESGETDGEESSAEGE